MRKDGKSVHQEFTAAMDGEEEQNITLGEVCVHTHLEVTIRGVCDTGDPPSVWSSD